MGYKLGSLFDGSGGFPLAGSLCGITPAWAAEVEPYPIAVTRSRFPDMKHLGDISKIKGGEIDPVEIITFGSPCQDLSLAGKRAGLKHEDNGDDETTRSGLFMEAVRIIKEMRGATDGRYPAFALWENVHGAFSSNKGEDFHTVLEELIKIVEPGAVMPAVPKNGWPYADSYCGDGWSLAYRTFDAQYWGVPQRRRRIHLVLDLRGECAGKILFEREGLRGYFEAGGTPREGTAGNAEGGAGAADGAIAYRIGAFDSAGMLSKNPKAGIIQTDISATLDCNGGAPTSQQGGVCIVEPVPYTLKIRSGCEGGGKGALIQTDKSATLSTLNDQYLFQPMVFRKGTRPHSKDEAQKWEEAETANTLNTFDRGEARANELVCEAYGVDCRNFTESPELYPTLQAKPNGGQSLNYSGAVRIQYIVRRLTPTECSRLQGFADRWGDIDPKEDFTEEEYRFWLEVRNTHAAINGRAVKEYTKEQMLTWYNKLHTDSAEYKMWGNGIALPPALYCMQGIWDELDDEMLMGASG